MTSHIVQRLNEIYHDLNKALTSENNEEERVTDILNELMKIPISIEILREVKIGQLLQKVKSQFADSSLGNEAKKLLNKWRKDCDTKKSDSEDTKETTTSKESGKKPIKFVTLSSEDSEQNSPKDNKLSSTSQDVEDSDEWILKSYKELSEPRKKVVDLLIGIMKIGSDQFIAKVISIDIERSINAFLPFDNDKVAYNKKAQTLILNLKKNEKLRNEVTSHVLMPDDLVKLDSKELATDELRADRERQLKEQTNARRADIYILAKQEIQKDLKIGGDTEFVCRKCKSNKTSHYALQTRSSDEPMTVFVNCINCGNRWRC